MQSLVNAWEARKRYEAGVTMGEFERPQLPTASEGMMQMFLGERILRVFREGTKRDADPTRYRG
jgi:hypothetical protein